MADAEITSESEAVRVKALVDADTRALHDPKASVPTLRVAGSDSNAVTRDEMALRPANNSARLQRYTERVTAKPALTAQQLLERDHTTRGTTRRFRRGAPEWPRCPMVRTRRASSMKSPC